MIELPEALSLSKQLNAHIVGKTVCQVLPPTKPHKFCWFNGDPVDYDEQLRGSKVTGAEGFGIYVEMVYSNGAKLCVNDGVNIRLVAAPSCASDIDMTPARNPAYTELAKTPRNYQLLIAFDDGTALAFSVAMYGGIVLHHGDYDNEYYLKSRTALTPGTLAFAEHFWSLCKSSKPTLSAKAFLATEQRFPGIGNGTLQDILFAAGIHPKRKLSTLDPEELDRLLACTVSVIQKMTETGGRDTEKDIFGHSGAYRTRMSKNTLSSGCPTCGSSLIKETYLGGSLYYCPDCQTL